jgi:UPF0755 protein
MTSQTDKTIRRRRVLFGSLAVLVSVGLLAGITTIASDSIRDFISKFQIADYSGEPGPETMIVIEPGDDGAAVARKMVDADIILSFDAIYRDMLTADFTIYPGTYTFPTKLSGQRALEILIEGKNRVVVQTTIPEGFRIREIVPQLVTDLKLEAKDIEAAIEAIQSRLPEEALNAEGYLFPATYTFDPGITAQTVIDTMVDRTEAELEQYGIALKDSFDVVNLAALIQSEAKLEEDFYKVARVFQNRLDIGMMLQSDATVNYGTNGKTVTTTDAQRADKSPYNTYVYTGLPAGPISNPGELAIEAAIRPADGDWLFFVTVNLKTGETKFSVTLAEHERAAQEFYAWLRENPEWND